MGQFMLGVVFFCITALMVDSHRALHKFLRAYWIGGLFGASLGILALFLGTRSVGFGKDPNFFGLLMASMIPRTIRLSECPSHGQTIFQYDIHSPGSVAYDALAKEFAKRFALK